MTSASINSSMIAWLRLARVSAMPSAVSNILAGFLLSQKAWEPTGQLLLLIVSSCCLYSSGMILNDVCDQDSDLQLNPGRPIPSKQITTHAAVLAYLVLTALGLFASSLVGSSSFMIAGSIAISVLLYDCVLKRTVVAPVFMGLCRLLNILLGASLTGFHWSPLLIVYAIALAILITGLTYFARNERRVLSGRHLRASVVVMSLGAAGLFAMVFVKQKPLLALAIFVVVLLLILNKAFLNFIQAISKNDSSIVRRGVIALLRSLILLDAAVCFLVCPDQPLYAIAVSVLIFPAKYLGRWISST